MTNEQRRAQGFKKGHKNIYSGKKMKWMQFKKAYELYVHDRKINQEDFAALVGISVPTLKKRLTEFMLEGYIDGKYFTNGERFINSWYQIKEEEYEAVRKMYHNEAVHEFNAILKVLINELDSHWYHAVKSQQFEYAEGLKTAMRLAEDLLYGDIKRGRHRFEKSDSGNSPDNSGIAETGEGLRDTQDSEGDNNFRV